jgi:hypothetical protein
MRIVPPSKNLGCLGFNLHKNLYIDFYRSPHWGSFINLRGRKLWLRLNGFKYEGYLRDVVFRLRVHKLAVCRKHLLVH